MRLENEAANRSGSDAGDLTDKFGPYPSMDRRLPWSSRTIELERDPSRKVRAVRWSRGDEIIITLQWFAAEAGGDWTPLNSPPHPEEF